VQLLRKHEVPLIEDDVYAELYYGQHAPKPAKAFDTEGLVLHCGSFAKSLAPGYRVGWVAAGRYAQKVERLKLMTSLCASMPAQAAIADYLQHGGYDRHLRKLRNSLEDQLRAMLGAVARHFPSQTRVSQPSGGYFLWLELPEQVDSLKVFKVALAQGISIAPGPMFSPTRRFKNCIRLNYGSPWSDTSERAMETLGKIIRSMMGA
jgi:DNA-binding transcriptional MocR family regulator